MLKAEHSTAEPASMTSSGAPQVESVKSEDNWRTRLAKQFRTASPDKGEAVVEDILGGGHSRSRSSSPLKVRLDEIFKKISFHSFHQDCCHCRNFCLIVLLDRQFLWKTPPQGDCGLENSRIQVNFHRVELAPKVHPSVRILKHFKMVKVMKVNEITDHFLCPLSLADLLDRRRNEGGNGQLALDSNGQGSHAQEIRIRLLAADSRLSWSQPIAHHGRHRLRYIQRPGKRSDSSSWNLIGCGCVMVQDSIVSIGGRMYLRRR